MWNLQIKSNSYGLCQIQKFKHPDLHDEDVIEIDPSSPFSSRLLQDSRRNPSLTFLITGDQNAGKSTFLHACVDANNSGFTQFSSFLPTLSSCFTNCRFSTESEFDVTAQRIQWSRDEGEMLDTDLARCALVMSGNNYNFLLSELDLEQEYIAPESSSLPLSRDPIFASLEILEFGGDWLDRVLHEWTHNSKDDLMTLCEDAEYCEKRMLSPIHFQEVFSSSLRLVVQSNYRGFLFFINAQTFNVTRCALRFGTLMKVYSRRQEEFRVTFVITRLEQVAQMDDKSANHLSSLKYPWSEVFSMCRRIFEEDNYQFDWQRLNGLANSPVFNRIRNDVTEFVQRKWKMTNFEIIPAFLTDLDSQPRVSPGSIFLLWSVLLKCHWPHLTEDSVSAIDYSLLVVWAMKTLDHYRMSPPDGFGKMNLVPVSLLAELSLENSEDEIARGHKYLPLIKTIPIAYLFHSLSTTLLDRGEKAGLFLVGSCVAGDHFQCFLDLKVTHKHTMESTLIVKCINPWLVRLPYDSRLWRLILDHIRRQVDNSDDLQEISLAKNAELREWTPPNSGPISERYLDSLQWMLATKQSTITTKDFQVQISSKQISVILTIDTS